MNHTINQLQEKRPLKSRLTPIEFATDIIYTSGEKRQRILCKCECGNDKTVIIRNYLSGKTLRCGLYCKLNVFVSKKSSGDINRVYILWLDMKNRCTHDKKYIQKGITVCKEWINDFGAFHSWAILNGCEIGLQLDRINNNGIYKPSNCRFATPLVNVSNRDCTIYIEYENKRLTIMEWSKLINICWQTIYNRLRTGWGIEDVLSTKKHQGSKLIKHKKY